MRDLGAKLFVLYLRLADCAGTAEGVIAALEGYSLHQNERTRNALRAHLRKQAVNIDCLFAALETLGWALQLLDPSISSDLQLFLGPKEKAIKTLASTMASGSLQLGLNQGIMYELQQHIGAVTESASGDERRLAVHLSMAVSTAPVVPTDPIANKDSMEIAEEAAVRLSIVRDYLSSGKPQQQVQNINDAVEKLHGILTANFSVVEIMPTVKQLLGKPNRG